MSPSVFAILDSAALFDTTSRCIECEACISVCCTAGREAPVPFTPMARIATARAFLSGEKPSADDVVSLYHCTECGRCETVCPVEIPISEVIADTKALLVKEGLGPLEKHERMISGIFKNRNAVGKPAQSRLDWIPEHLKDQVAFEESEATTLLYVGCLSSWVDTATAAASLEILLAAGLPFKLLRDEFCCGIYPYNAGKWDEAYRIFSEMAETFHTHNITRIIVPCAGCHRAFSSYYPRLLKDFDIEIVHMAEVIRDLLKDGKLSLSKESGTVSFHDACKTGRKAGLFDAPREVLKASGARLSEFSENREDALCCGSGSGVRSLDAGLSMNIAGELLASAPENTVISTCPFCIFNLNYTARKTMTEKKAVHIATYVRSKMA